MSASGSEIDASVSVLICTYQRPGQLALLLADLAAQTRLPQEVVVVDNDASASARQTVERFAETAPFPLSYDVQPQKNISITRNRTVARATGVWLAFIDDDERAPPHWLESLLQTAVQYQAAGAQAPVIYRLPDDAPGWLSGADHYGAPREPTGTTVSANRAWINNTLIRASALADVEGPFDEVFGLTGGEDSDMLARLIGRGHKLVWCDEAPVVEPVAESRMRLKWLLLRAMRGGQDYATHWKRGLFGQPGPLGRVGFVFMSCVKLLAGLLGALLALPFGAHHSVSLLRRAAANVGKLSALFGFRYQEYASAPSKQAPRDTKG